jgi:threonine efflux protein
MHPWIDLAAFAAIMALGQFSPGPDWLLITRTSLRHGAAAGAWMALGIACGLMVHSTAALAGLALILQQAGLWPDLLRLAAAAYLLWLACLLLRSALRSPAKPAHETAGNAPATSPAPGRPFLQGLLCNLLNPKAAIFLAAVCAPFLQGNRPAWWPAALWIIVVFQGGLLWLAWARLLQWPPLRRAYHRASRTIDATFGLALASLALLLWLR